MNRAHDHVSTPEGTLLHVQVERNRSANKKPWWKFWLSS
jgi:hypothetical protein